MNALEKIERLLPGLKMNKASLAAKAKVSPGTISRIEPPYDDMEFGTCRRIAHALGVTADWLFDDRQPYPPPESGQVVILQADARFIGLEDELPPKMTREQILEAIWDYKRAHARQGQSGSGPGGAKAPPAPGSYEAKRADHQSLPGRPADDAGREPRKAAR